MTSEIAVMNKMAVALATDSAVTIPYQRGEKTGSKIFFSANKLFALSTYQPIGIMIYGRASFMEVPWETIVKMYRKKIGKKKFDFLEDYGKGLMSYLGENMILFPSSLREKHFKSYLSVFLKETEKKIEHNVKEFLKKSDSITENQIKRIIDDEVSRRLDGLKKRKLAPTFKKEDAEKISKNNKKIIEDTIKKIFKDLPMNKTTVNKIHKFAGLLFTKTIYSSNLSGIVIAGFGEKDVFPKIAVYELDLVVGNKVKYKYDVDGVNNEQDSIIIPFAQRDEVSAFIEGIHPRFKGFIEGYIEEIIDKYPDRLLNKMKKLGSKDKQKVTKELKRIKKKLLTDYRNKFSSYSKIYFQFPITTSVSVVPKEELALMAETLINLTSFKRKITFELEETVGEPIDVAVISKGDGFIWIKRKQYFTQELNPLFIQSYQFQNNMEEKK